VTVASLRRLLDGWRLSSPVIVFYALSSFIGGLISMDSSEPRVARVLIASATVSLLVAGCLAVLCRVWASLGTSSQTNGARRFIIVAIGAGALRASVLLPLASALDVVPPAGGAVVVANSVVSAIVWLGLGGLIVSSLDAYAARYADLLSRRARLSSGGDSVLDWDALPDVRRMKSTLQSVVRTTAGEPSPAALARASLALRQEIETNLRPLSRRLWFGAPEEVPHVRWSYTLRDAVSGYSVPTPAILLLWLLGSAVGGAALLGAVRGVLAAALSTLALGATLWIGHRLVRRRPGLMVGSLAMVASAVVPILLADAVLRVMGFESSLLWTNGLMVLLPATLLGMLLAAAAIALADADRIKVLLVVGHSSDRGADASLDVASTYVHNSLQAELTGIAMQLEAAGRSSDEAGVRAALERAQSLLGRSISEDFAAYQEDPLARADRVSRAWQGICTVTVQIDPETHADPRLALAVRAGEELISNAVRHSGAQRVHLDVRRWEGSLEVTCEADTVGDPRGEPGLGAHLLASASPSGVSAMSVGGGTRYRVRVE